MRLAFGNGRPRTQNLPKQTTISLVNALHSGLPLGRVVAVADLDLPINPGLRQMARRALYGQVDAKLPKYRFARDPGAMRKHPLLRDNTIRPTELLMGEQRCEQSNCPGPAVD